MSPPEPLRLTPLTLSRNEPVPQIDYEMEVQRIQDEMLARLQNYRSKQGATERANTLLFSFLDTKQRQDWQIRGRFDITVPSGNHYRLTRSTVIRLNERGENTGEKFCLVPRHGSGLPEGDTILSRLLMLQANESLFLQKARRWGVAGCDAPVARTTPRRLDYGGEFRHAEEGWSTRPPYERREARLIRFTQRLDQIEERYNWGLPPNVRAIPERNTIVWEGVEYRIVNHTIEQEPFPYFAHGTRTVTLEVEPVNQPPGRWTDGGRYMTGYAYVPMTEPGNDCDTDRGAGLTATVSLGPDEAIRIREYIEASRSTTPVSLYGSQWYVTEWNHEYGLEGPEMHTFSLVRR